MYSLGFTPKAEQNTAHHVRVVGCEEPGTHDKFWSCRTIFASKSDLLKNFPLCKKGKGYWTTIYAWARDAPDLKLPDGVGFRYENHNVMK